MKRCAVFVGGDIGDYAAVAVELKPDDLLIAADSGARHLSVLGKMPHMLIGDMDSIDTGTREQFLTAGTPCRIYLPEKDETDGELAIEAALDSGAEEILIFGILGNRLDHFLGVLSLLKRTLDVGVRARMISDNQDIWLIRGQESLRLPVGSLVSFVPFGEAALGVTLQGFKYPLFEYDYHHGKPIGLSNVIEKTPAIVTIGRGILVAIHTKKD